MAIPFIGAAPANFLIGRPAGFVPEAIVLHRTGGTRDAIRGRFHDPGSSVSAHYVVGLDGHVDQCVRETDVAFHAGLVIAPTWPRLRPNVNPNHYTIGIELEGDAGSAVPEPQLDALAGLIAEIAARWGFPVAASHVVPHSAIRVSARCPGDGFPMAALLALAVADPGSTDAMEPQGPAAPVTATGARLGVPIDRTRMALPAAEFHGTVTPKDLIVLHFTAGTTAKSAFDTWRQRPERVATSYLVDVDGTVFEVFPPECWAAHLGVKHTNNAHDRRSIGIEIANVGPLQPSADDPTVLNWWPKKSPTAADFTTRFCTVDERQRYVEASYRGKAHFAAFPDVQVDAVAALVRGLCARFGIAATLPTLAKRFDDDLASFARYRGVCSHANFRRDKWDIGPAFPWDRLGL